MPGIDERYRPKTWGDVAGNERAVKLCRILAESVRDTGAPEVALLTGESGIGKTTCAYIMARVAGAHLTQTHVIESGGCSIDNLRHLAEGFCYTTPQRRARPPRRTGGASSGGTTTSRSARCSRD